MIAAIYARKSTEQNTSDEEKSVTRQIAHARALAARKGWTIAEEHVYADDGISGAEFLKRAGLTALLTAVRSRPCPVQALITMEVSRLGREQTETAVIVRELMRAGVRLFTYADSREITQDSALDKFSLNALNFVAEMERELSRTRTREAMRSKTARGHVAGGIVFGYRNVRGADHVDRAIIDDQAAVIRRIFQEIAAGRGYAKVAQGLNADAIPCPRGRRWAMTCVREMVFRDLYRGRIVYGPTRWQDRGGTKVKVRVPESEWLTVEAPHLRIVQEELWRAAHERLDRMRQTYLRSTGGKLWGAPRPASRPGTCSPAS
jgi:site-specific DNA recombinase